MPIHFEEYGQLDAPLLVFIHGGGVGGWMWEEQIKFFQSFHCIVPTLPEHGGQKGGIPFSIRESAKLLNDLIIEKANGQTVNVVGFSIGAQVLVEMLSLQPTLIDKAMINSALARPIALPKSILGVTVKLTYPLIRQKAFAKMQAKALYIPPNFFDRYYEESCYITVEGLTRVLDENMSFKIPETFSKVTSKMLVTVGEKERGMMKKSAHDLAMRNANCHKIVWPDIGHGISLKEPRLFNDILAKWLCDEVI
ncbi:alpha/beta fold hydrolase [Lysinibacillus sp. NPDC097287]|uniref:alpha/beta fold hydrolase n=1 Tax=Lysinibacillus sp. NPDC097287 TaxID=3364144 RepID=UPI003825D2DD